MQRVHTVSFFLPVGVSMCMVCRLGLIFLGFLPLIYILSWATLFPKTVVFPQSSQRKELPSFSWFGKNSGGLFLCASVYSV